MELQIIDYDSKYAKDFYDLNIEWLQTHFYVEPYDEAVLSKPETYIINKGGCIFFAQIKDSIVGTVALMPTEKDGVFELTKMAVLPKARGKSIGKRLMEYCITYAKQNSITALLLYSNTKLESAIHLYRTYGFQVLELENHTPYQRADIKMLLKL